MQMEAAFTCSSVQCIESSKLCIVGIIYNGNMGTLMDDLTSGGAGVALVHARLAVQLWPRGASSSVAGDTSTRRHLDWTLDTATEVQPHLTLSPVIQFLLRYCDEYTIFN